MRRLFLLLAFSTLLVNGSLSAASEAAECVVVLHGMGRTHSSMAKIEARLVKEGYGVLNSSYDSTSDLITTLAESAVGAGVQYCEQQNANIIHFVTHSLGGILVRAYLQDREISRLGRIVMLAPPNQGSEVADLLQGYGAYELAMGPAGQALSTKPGGFLSQLKPIVGEIGIIAGNSTSDPWFSPLIPGEDDGKVSVERAKLEEMKDFLVVDSGHTFIMRNDEVIEQIIYFLAQGKFEVKSN